MAATVFAQDINGKRISVGTEVAVRCQITSLNPVVPGVTNLGAEGYHNRPSYQTWKHWR
jgi:hypothetical protein